MSYVVLHVWGFTYSNLLELITILKHCALLYNPLSSRDVLLKPPYLNKKRNRTIALAHLKAHC